MSNITDKKINQFDNDIKEVFPGTRTVKNVQKDIPSLLSNWFFIVYSEKQNHFEISFNVDVNPTRVAMFMKVFLGKKYGYDLKVFHEHYVEQGEANTIKLHWGTEARELFLGTMEKVFKVKFNQEIYNQIMLLQGQYGGKQ